MKSSEILNKVIKPALEKTMRWYHDPQDDYKFIAQIQENVWEHIQSCLRIADEFVKKYPKILHFINYENLVQTILFHDAPEGFAKYGDVSQYDPDKERKKLENDEDRIFRERLVGKLGISTEVYDLYLAYENRSTIEGAIAKLIDQLDARDKWWKNITDEYRIHYVTKEKSLAFRMQEFIVKANILNLGAPLELVTILLNFTAEFMISGAELLDEDLAKEQIDEVEQLKNQLLLEYES